MKKSTKYSILFVVFFIGSILTLFTGSPESNAGHIVGAAYVFLALLSIFMYGKWMFSLAREVENKTQLPKTDEDQSVEKSEG